MMVQLSFSEVSLNHFHILVVVSVVRKKLDDFIDVICVILQVGANFLVTEETLIKGFSNGSSTFWLHPASECSASSALACIECLTA